MSHIFISYSRKDVDFAQKIVTALAANDLDTWIDWKSIPKGEDWLQEIYHGIEEADAFLFLISTDSVASEPCNLEIAHAVKNGKRILPVFISNVDNKEVYRVTEKFIYKESKDEINRRNFIFCREGQDDFNKAIEETRKTIHADYEWLKYHARLQVKALEWERRKDPKDTSRLLRGKELREAEQQLALAGNQIDPQPTELQRNYLLASQRNEVRQRRQITISLSVGLAMLAVLAVFAWIQRNNAIQKTKIARAGELSARALYYTTSNPALSFLFSVEAFNYFDNSQTRGSLFTTIHAHPTLARLLFEHNGYVSDIAFNSDKEILAIGFYDGMLVLWNVLNQKVVTKYPSDYEKLGSLNAIDFSPTGDILAVGHGNSNGAVVLWDISDPVTPSKIGMIEIDRYVVDVSFNPDGTSIAVISAGNLSIWDITNPKAIYQRQSPTASDMIFGQDGGILLISDEFNLTTLWTVTSWDIPVQIDQFTEDHVTSVAFSKDGELMALGNSRGEISLWNISEPKMPVKLSSTVGHSNSVTSMAFNSSKRFLASGSEDSTLSLWNISDLSLPLQVYDMQAHTKPIQSLVFIDENILASGGGDNPIILWDVAKSASSEKMLMLPAPSVSLNTILEFGDEGKYVVIGGEETTTLWDISDLNNPIALRTFPEEYSGLASATFSPRGEILVSGYQNNELIIWDITNLISPIQRIDLSNFDSYYYITKIRISPNREILATVSIDGTLTLWNIANLNTSIKISTISQESRIVEIAFFIDGRILALGNDDGTISFWDISIPSSPEHLITFKGHRLLVGTIAFSPDKMIMASGSNDGNITIWNISSFGTPTIVDRLPVDMDIVTNLTFSLDGKLLVVGGCKEFYDICPQNEIFVWDINKHQFLFDQPINISKGISSIAIKQNNEVILSGSADGIITEWNISPWVWIDYACKVVGRNFTQAEWQQYFPGEEYRITCPQWPAGE